MQRIATAITAVGGWVSMASGDSDKTEKPTPKKLREARKEGQVARSQDVVRLGRPARRQRDRAGAGAQGVPTSLQTLLVVGMAVMKDPTSERAVSLLGDGLHDVADDLAAAGRR